MAATYPELAGAVVTLSGSGVVTSGIPGHPTLLENFQDARAPWSLGGRPLDFVGGTGDEFERQCRSGGPVEAIDGPMLMLSGADDQQWPFLGEVS